MPLLTPGASRFKPLALFKQGRFNVVTLVLEMATQKERVARLLSLPPGATEVALLEGINRETRALKTLQHPNLQCFDKVVEGAGGTWMLFEYKSGTPLSHYQDLESTVPDTWIMWWFHHILVALDALHTHDPPFVIGYLEPHDIVVADHRLAVCDLGLFEDLFPEVGANMLAKHPYLNFIAPEKRMAVQALPSVDVYAAGAVAFWLGTGHAPVVSGPQSQGQLLQALGEHRPDMPVPARELIASCLSFYPTLRPASARVAIDALAPVLQDMTGQEPPTPSDKSSFKKVARTTRNLLQQAAPDAAPPTPIFSESPKEAPLAEGAKAAEDEPTVAPWQEFLEDLSWQLRRHPVALTIALVLLLLAGSAWLQRALTPHQPPPTPIFTLASGHVLAKVERSQAQYNGEWRAVDGVVLGATIAAAPGGATLAYGHASLHLDADTVLTCSGREHEKPSILLSHGAMKVSTGPGDGLYVHLTAGNVLTVDASTQLSMDVTGKGAKPRYSFSCSSGSATLTVLFGTEKSLSPGVTLLLSPDGRHLEVQKP